MKTYKSPTTGKETMAIGREIKNEIWKSVDLYLKPSRAIATAFKDAIFIHEDGGAIQDSPRSYQGRPRFTPKQPEKRRA